MAATNWLKVVQGLPKVLRDHAEIKADLLSRWSTHPWEWLSGTDLDGRPIVWTTDELDSVHPTKPYPTDKDYLHYLVNILQEEPFILIDKCRQMVVSTTVLLFMDWQSRFRESRRWVLSKRTEEESKDMLRDKLRAMHLRLPDWVRAALPMKPRPAGKLIYPHPNGDSYILGANEAMAVGQARGGTASGEFVDEAAYQASFQQIITASLPMTARLICCTTPALGMPGGETFKGMIDAARGLQYHHLMDGLKTKKAESGFLIVELDYFADPAKRDPEWLERVRKLMPSEKDFRREILRDWTSPAGDAYYPEFSSNGGRDTYVRSAPGLIGRPLITILRGWDFGVRHPACVFAQLDEKVKRLWVLRELMPGWWDTGASDYGIELRSFRDAVRYLCGELGSEHLGPHSLYLIEKIAEEPMYPMPPWFQGTPENPIKFLDFALGKEVNKRSDEDELMRTRKMILAEGGISIFDTNEHWDVREEVMRELLKVKADGWPGLLLDPFCPILIRGMEGGIQYAKKTPTNRLPEIPAKEGYFEHLHEALNYIAVSVIPAVRWREHLGQSMALLGRSSHLPDDGVEFWVGQR